MPHPVGPQDQELKRKAIEDALSDLRKSRFGQRVGAGLGAVFQQAAGNPERAGQMKEHARSGGALTQEEREKLRAAMAQRRSGGMLSETGAGLSTPPPRR